MNAKRYLLQYQTGDMPIHANEI